jgi:eukaryotic-like serine/threonine-protein kinase
MTRAGSQVAQYRLGEPLGEGGMGVVYRAEDLTLKREVAIKFLQRSDDGQARARFLREARAAGGLDHPNIGTVYEVGESDGAPYFVMPLYPGETLRERLARGRLSINEMVSVAQQLCRALAAAHRANIVHRDLKPGNVMLLPDGSVKLLDFGLAKVVSVDDDTLTQDGAILGTLAYMAPEQLRHQDGVDARADLWSLGAVMYEMLAGKPPFGFGPAATVVGRILTENPAPLEGFLGEVATQLLRKDARKRPSLAEIERRLASRKTSQKGLWVGGAIVLTVGMLGLAAVAARQPPAAPATFPAEMTTEDRDRAVALYASANQKFDAKDFSGAADDFEASYALSHEAGLLYNAAQNFRLAKQPGRALVFYEAYLRAGDVSPELRKEVEFRIAEMRQAIKAARPF